MANVATIKPTGCTVARKGWQFTFSWKIGDKNYGALQTFYETETVSTGATTETWYSVGATATSKAITLSNTKYYPSTANKLTKIGFTISGQRANESGTTYTMSGKSSAAMSILVPNTPTITQAQPETNRTVFTWATSVSDTDGRLTKDVEYQSILVKDCNTTTGQNFTWGSSTTGWRTGTGNPSGNVTITEDSGMLAGNSYTRWIRVRARGPAGDSAWRYAYHTYARPLKPGAPTGTATTVGQGTDVMMKWSAQKNTAHPIDWAEAQYLFAEPAAGMAPPAGGQWAVGQSSIDTAAADGAAFGVDRVVGIDECLWVRVAVYHDDATNVTYSNATRLQVGKMALPTGLTVSLNMETFRAVVTAVDNSDVPDSQLAVIFKNESGSESVVGTIPHGETTVTVQCPTVTNAGNVSFGVAAFQGAKYASANMTSETVWQGGDVPAAPTNVRADPTETAGEVLVSWTWAWQSANRAEVSWSQNPNAWTSTDRPSTYTLNSSFAPNWRIAKLQTGVTWYFRVRLGKYASESEVWGPYSDVYPLSLTSAPNKPELTLDKGVVAVGDHFKASWTYMSTDGTAQAIARIYEVTEDGTTVLRTVGGTTQQVQSLTFSAGSGAFSAGTHYLAARVQSASGRLSDYSDPVQIIVAEAPTLVISQTSIAEITIPTDEGTRTVNAITAMPISVYATGAGWGGATSIDIIRNADYIMDRPDEDVFNGYEGELVYSGTRSGESPFIINRTDLLGPLDDTAQYRMIITVTNSNGLSKMRNVDFEPHWTHQAIVPEGTAVISDGIAVIAPTAPTGTLTGDVCDIYRLSADKPVLVYESAAFGESYVDPYPAIGESAGYRLVFRTADGDYITEDNTKAWLDISAGLSERVTIIDFDGRRVTLEHNMDISHTWEKAFTETRYLGGAIQGDWNPGISKHASVNAEMVATDDPELIADMHRLASYAGICHVRTVDGLSFAADVQVSEARSYESTGKISVFNLAISEVAAQGFDGVPLDEWEAETEGE